MILPEFPRNSKHRSPFTSCHNLNKIVFCLQETLGCVQESKDQAVCTETNDKEDSWTMVGV